MQKTRSFASGLLHGAKPEWLRAIITRQDSELVFARTQVSAMKVQVLAPAANESGDKSPQSKLKLNILGALYFDASGPS